MKDDALDFSGLPLALDAVQRTDFIAEITRLQAQVTALQVHERQLIIDITERKALEAQLKRTSNELEAILNSTLVGISYNQDRRIVWVNDKYVAMTGFERATLIGQSTRMFYDDDATYTRNGTAAYEALRHEGTCTSEQEITRRDGTVFWAVLSGHCVVDCDPDAGIIWTMLDITERHTAEEENRIALQRQTELNDLRSRFVSMTSHEFRTPLATILSSAELLRHYNARMTQEQRTQALIHIEDSVHRMTRMVERVLLIGQSDAHMLEFHPTHLPTDAACQDIMAAVLSGQPEASPRLSYQYTAQATHHWLDENLLRHILSNLLSNAIKYSPQGGGISFCVSDASHKAQFDISDQGIGIPEAEIPHLFESFQRASNVGHIPGTGLGLSIVKKSVALHGGTISVASQQGRGTHFTVTL